MEAKKRLYIVSFGDSDKYRVEFDDVDNVDPFHHTNPLAHAEHEIEDYLNRMFPDEPLAYFETPKVTEVRWEDRAKYASYPVLDEEAVKKIESTLRTGVENMEDQKTLNNNGPHSA